jgi:hypothetical protein
MIARLHDCMIASLRQGFGCQSTIASLRQGFGCQSMIAQSEEGGQV